ncbi:MAG: ABC transporter permease [Micrococcales bacterium]
MKKFDTLSVLVFIRSWGITTLLALLLIVFSIWAAPVFGTLENFSLLLGNAAIPAVFAAAIAMGAYSGALDLSVPGTAAVSSVVMAMMIGSGIDTITSILVALLIGIAVGFGNGLIVQTGLNPLAVTIGTLSITSGLAAILTDGLPLFNNMEKLEWLGVSTYFGIPSLFYVVVFIYVVGTIFLTKTRGGIRFLAAGGNPEALRRAGVNSNAYRLLGFTLSGLIAAIGGVMNSAYTAQATPAAPTSVLFDGLTAVALSGLALSGGRGSLPKVWVGSMVVTVIGAGLLIKNIQPFWTISITGALLIAALAGEHYIGKAVAKQAVSRSTVSAHKEVKKAK